MLPFIGNRSVFGGSIFVHPEYLTDVYSNLYLAEIKKASFSLLLTQILFP